MRLPVQRIITAAAIGFLTTVGVAQDLQEKPPTLIERLSDPVYISWVSHQDVAACVRCHLAGPNVGEIIGDQAAGLTPFSRREELEHWVGKDKHTIARRRVEPFEESRTKAELTRLIDRLDEMARAAANRLRAQGIQVDPDQVGLTKFPEEWIGESNFLSRRIADKLWGNGAVETEGGYALFRDNCLTCHGGYSEGDAGFDLAVTEQAKIGIGCLYCHQDGDNPKWITDHAAPNPEQNWRLLPPEQKTLAGMRDLVNTSTQADLCFDCHVGNRSKNMFVTHEMYAAGHPPLPSIEVQTFCSKMPQHWQTPSELYENLAQSPTREAYFALNYPGVVAPAGQSGAGETYWNTRKMLLGALVARKKTLDLLIETADAHSWADYSLYDCASCHHELQSDSLRQLRGYPAAPGRPRQHEWPAALMQLAYEFGGMEPASAAMQTESQLDVAFGAKPFGDPAEVAQAANALRDRIKETIASLEKKPVDASVAMTCLQKLTQTPVEDLVSYDSARQVVWAMQVIVGEMQTEGLAIDEATASAVKNLGVDGVGGISANLPSGRKQFIYSEALERDLEQRAAYDPALLRKQFIEIGKQLGVTQNAKLRFAR